MQLLPKRAIFTHKPNQMPGILPNCLMFIFLISSVWLLGQPAPIISKKDNKVVKKTFQAQKIKTPIKVDGKDDDSAWKEAEILTDFIQWDGHPGEKSTNKTEVKFLYSDDAVFVFAKNYVSPDSILKELTERDDIGNADWFGIIIDPFLSGINASEFIVSVAGNQFDAQLTENGEDTSWDAVWESETLIQSFGWTAEFKIPYFALRFPSKDIQDWGINFMRKAQKLQERTSWNKIDPEKNGFVNQAGIVTGIANIKPPVRLSLSPFATIGYEKTGAAKATTYGGGLDLKYGINNAFTLDMSIIPDFSQTQSDQTVQNISAFEQFYSENRLFFTEGTDLFNKGNILYTRRIGQGNHHYPDIDEDNIIHHPQTPQLINSMKITGRTDKKLGIGLLNVVEGRNHLTFNSIENKEEKELTNPLTNYNVIVLDQTLKNNSSISIINTNVLREGAFTDANVTALDFDLNNKEQKYGISGRYAISQILTNDEKQLGHKTRVTIGKRSGKMTGSVRYQEFSDDFSQSDLGYISRVNFKRLSGWVSYRENNPGKRLRNYFFNVFQKLEWQYNTNRYAEYGLDFNFDATTNKFFSFGLGLYAQPFVTYDYYEPRTDGRYFALKPLTWHWAYFDTDYRKKLGFSMSVEYGNRYGTKEHVTALDVSPSYRFSDKISVRIGASIKNRNHFNGYIYQDETAIGYDQLNDEDIIYGTRDRQEIVSYLSAKYTINKAISLSFFARNYWSQLSTSQLHLLTENGGLDPTPYQGVTDDGEKLHDSTFDYFYFDLIFRWRFRPGSDIFFTWKNNVSGSFDRIGYSDTISRLATTDAQNNWTLKVLYFLDYNDVFKR